MTTKLEDVFFFDLETTSADPSTACAVQIAYKVGEAENSYILNPGEPISAGAAAVHGITDAMVAELPGFKHYAQELYAAMDGKIWCAYNGIRFDMPIIRREFETAGYKVPSCAGKIDPFKVFCHYEGNPFKKGTRTLMAAHIFYCGCAFDGAHDALSDIIATVSVFKELESRYGIASMLEISNKVELNIDRKGAFKFNGNTFMPEITFGKYAGTPLKDIPVSYLHWIANVGIFPEETKKIAQDAIMGHFPVYRKI